MKNSTMVIKLYDTIMAIFNPQDPFAVLKNSGIPHESCLGWVSFYLAIHCARVPSPIYISKRWIGSFKSQSFL